MAKGMTRTMGAQSKGLPSLKVKTYTVANAPSASASGAGSVVFMSNGAAGSAILVFSDGTNWKRSDTGATAAAA